MRPLPFHHASFLILAAAVAITLHFGLWRLGIYGRDQLRQELATSAWWRINSPAARRGQVKIRLMTPAELKIVKATMPPTPSGAPTKQK